MNTHHMDVLLTVFALFSQNTCCRHTAQYLQHHVHQHGLWVWNKTSPATTMNLTSTCAPSDVLTPSAMPTGKWSDAITRAKAVVSGMSVQVLSQLATGCVTCHACHGCVTDFRPILGNPVEVTHVTSPGHV